MKKYIKVKDNPAKITHLKIELYYNKGNFENCYREEKTGYYLSVVPIERKERNGYTVETFGAFTGVKQLIKEVTRKSSKAEIEAEKLSLKAMDNLINYVCHENNLEIVAESEAIPA